MFCLSPSPLCFSSSDPDEKVKLLWVERQLRALALKARGCMFEKADRDHIVLWLWGMVRDMRITDELSDCQPSSRLRPHVKGIRQRVIKQNT